MSADHTTAGCDQLASNLRGTNSPFQSPLGVAPAYDDQGKVSSSLNDTCGSNAPSINPFSLSSIPLNQTDTESEKAMRTRRRKPRKKTEGPTRVVTTDVSGTNYVLLLVGENYVISGSFGIKPSAMTPSLVHIDTCSGVNVIRRQCLPPNWEDHREPLTFDPGLGDANNQPLRFAGVIRLSLRLGNRTYRLPFLIANNFAVDVLLGTSFHNTYIEAIKCIKRTIVFKNGDEVPIVRVNHSRTRPGLDANKGAVPH